MDEISDLGIALTLRAINTERNLLTRLYIDGHQGEIRDTFVAQVDELNRVEKVLNDIAQTRKELGTQNCIHTHYSAGHCGEIGCWNYYSDCSKHSYWGHPEATCSRVKVNARS